MASPQESANKEVKVILDLVRTKADAARSNIFSIVVTTLVSGLKPGQKVNVTVNMRGK